MELVASFVRNPVKVAVAVLLVVLFGVISLQRMPIQLTPEVEIPTLTVETRWPGASPQEVEREIIQEQEEQLKGVEGLRKLSSESAESLGRITLEFEIGTPISEAMLRVNTRLQQVREYPENADEPVISSANSANPIAWFILRPLPASREQIQAVQQAHPELAATLEPVLAAHSSGLALRRLNLLIAEREAAGEEVGPLRSLLPPEIEIPTLRDFAEDFLEARFERVDGVANSNVLGGQERELRVIVDPQQLAARELTIADVRQALRGQNVDTSGGDVWDGKRRWIVRTLGQFTSPQQVETVILARRDDAPVYLGDVATVELGYKKPDGFVRNFGTSCLAVNCERAAGANVLHVMERLRVALEELNAGILRERGLVLEQVYDETEYIHSAIGLVNDNILVGGLLTILTLLIFLRSGRSTLVISLAIPTSIVGTFLVMHLLGRTLNVISLAGLAFAVGMLVDNSIVVLENIYRRFQLGESRFDATVRGTQEVWGAVVASTLTTLAVFLPVLFVQEEAGQLFRDIALAISAGVGLSMVVSAVVIPPATARILPQHYAPAPDQELLGTGPAWLHRVLAPFDWLGGTFVALVTAVNRFVLHSRTRQLATVALMFVASLSLSWLLTPKVEYLPKGNRNLVFGILLPPPGYNLDRLTELGRSVELSLRPYWDVDPESAEFKASGLPAIGDFFFVARGRQVFLGLRAYESLRASELVPLVGQVLRQVPGTIGIANQASLFERGVGVSRSIDVEITGPELEHLIVLGQQVFGGVMNPDPSNPLAGSQALPKPSLDLSNPEVHVLPRWEQAADLGVSAAELGYWVDALADGAYASDYYLGGDKIDLSIVGLPENVRRASDVRALPIATPGGQVVPISALAEIRIGAGPEQINHRERQRSVTIQVTPPAAMPLEEAMAAIEELIVAPLRESGQLEGNYQINLAGTADKLRQTWDALSFNVILALLITYLLMAALFESWLYPLVIICTVPLGAVGGFAALWLLNLFVFQPLDVLTMLGFVILIGTVVNNPILIVHQSLGYMRDDGFSPRAAILESARTRIRPIFMTTATTILGLLPLVLFPGAGSELYRGLGAVLLGGLLVSTVFTLVFVPALFALTLDAQHAVVAGFRRWRSAARPFAAQSQPEDDEALAAGTAGKPR